MNRPPLTDFITKATGPLKQCPNCHACEIPATQIQCDDCGKEDNQSRLKEDYEITMDRLDGLNATHENQMGNDVCPQREYL